MSFKYYFRVHIFETVNSLFAHIAAHETAHGIFAHGHIPIII